MRFYSTRDRSRAVNFSQAVLNGLAGDGGLYVPEEIPRYRFAVEKSLSSMSFLDIAFETIHPYVYPEIPDAELRDLISGAFNFTAPLVPLTANGHSGEGEPCRSILELFHGPTAAFKDFGARFMARAFSYFRRDESRPLKILVATSGDTGGAVADGFFGIEGISVTVLYPKGRVSPLQEKQIAGLGKNISALAVEGSFDDCQRLVKAAFNNSDLRKKLDMSSANSINIARLIPQIIYYSSAAGAFLKTTSTDQPLPVFCVPSGNFGNLTAGLYAKKMGAPIGSFVAATNINKTFPDYLSSGNYHARSSLATISNAMDVGAPSNFERLSSHWTLEEMRALIASTFVSDDETRETIKTVHDSYGYILDPHGAVGWKAVDKLLKQGVLSNERIAILETAHPAKFAETVEPLAGPIALPSQLAEAEKRTVSFRVISPEEGAFFAELR
ncbi:MAG: threonine synthase [Spirochaetaceae bacterium]|jgi:threonine synthase|nr:threonine synthase [Spirochaetaceae bacterium]